MKLKNLLFPLGVIAICLISCVDISYMDKMQNKWYVLDSDDTVLTIGIEYNSDSCRHLLVGSVYDDVTGLIGTGDGTRIEFDSSMIKSEIMVPAGQTLKSYTDSIKRLDPMYNDPELLGEEQLY